MKVSVGAQLQMTGGIQARRKGKGKGSLHLTLPGKGRINPMDKKSVQRLVNSKVCDNSSPEFLEQSLLSRTVFNAGLGAFGKVSTGNVYWNDKVFPVAIKTNGVSSSCDQMKSEAELAMSFHHPNLLKHYGFREETSDAEHKVHIVSEYMASTLEKYLETGRVRENAAESTLSEEVSRPLNINTNLAYLRDIASAVKYLHDKGLIHGDLKLDNIFLDSRGHAEVGDFGRTCKLEDAASIYLDRKSSRFPPEMTILAGIISPTDSGFNSPETLTDTDSEGGSATSDTLCSFKSREPGNTGQDQTISHAVDIYCLGVVALSLVTGNSSWPDIWTSSGDGHITDHRDSVINRLLVDHRSNPKANALIQEVIQPCLALNSSQRPDIDQVLETIEALLNE